MHVVSLAVILADSVGGQCHPEILVETNRLLHLIRHGPHRKQQN
jgi:hypothetical protein